MRKFQWWERQKKKKKCGRSNYIKTAVKADRVPSDIRLHAERCVVLQFLEF